MAGTLVNTEMGYDVSMFSVPVINNVYKITCFQS
jgi:hypothetical protein